MHQSADAADRAAAAEPARRDRLGDRPSARRQGSAARRRGGAPAAGRQPRPHRAGRPRLHAAMGGRARAPRWRPIRAIAGATTCRPPPCAGCWRAATPWSIIVVERGRRQRDLRGRRRRRADPGLAHGRQCRPAGHAIIPATSRSATRKRWRACCGAWSASRASSHGWARRSPDARRCSGRRARSPRGAGCLPSLRRRDAPALVQNQHLVKPDQRAQVGGRAAFRRHEVGGVAGELLEAHADIGRHLLGDLVAQPEPDLVARQSAAELDGRIILRGQHRLEEGLGDQLLRQQHVVGGFEAGAHHARSGSPPARRRHGCRRAQRPRPRP